MFSSRITFMISWAYFGSPSSMQKANELGLLHAKMSCPLGSLEGMAKPAGTEGTISIFLSVVGAVLYQDLIANPMARRFSILKCDMGT
jgi:hypothetical protein